MGAITLWSGTAANVNIDDQAGTVTILAAGTFKLDSVTGSGLGHINLIKVADGVTGTVTVHVLRRPWQGGGPGAVNIGEIRLANDQGASLTGVLAELDITGNFGTQNPSVATSGGTLHIGDSLVDLLELNSLTAITVDDAVTPTGAVIIHGDFGGQMDFLNAVQGSITIDGDITDTSSRIFIKQLNGGHVECQNLEKAGPISERFMLGIRYGDAPGAGLSLVQSGTIVVNGTLSGAIHFRAQTEVYVTVGEVNATALSGPSIGGIFSFGGFRPDFQLDVLGDFLQGTIAVLGTEDDTLPDTVLTDLSGRFNVAGDFGGPSTTATFRAEMQDSEGGLADCDTVCPDVDLEAVVHVDGDMYGQAYVTGDLNGRILIDGALHNGSGDEIEIEGALGAATAAIAINYDGFSDNDNDWGSGATVKVGNDVYDET